MLGGDKVLATTLRGLKAAILNVEVAEGKRAEGLPDDAIISLFQKEVKKRQESADLFGQGGNTEKQAAELAEKEVITKYLPAQLSEEEIGTMIDEIISKLTNPEAPGSPSQEDSARGGIAMGQVIGAVKAKAGPAGDGAVIARLVKGKLSQ